MKVIIRRTTPIFHSLRIVELIPNMEMASKELWIEGRQLQNKNKELLINAKIYLNTLACSFTTSE